MWVLNAPALVETCLYDLVFRLLNIALVLRWHYILGNVILQNYLYWCYLICPNFMDIQLVVKIQTLVLTATLLNRYQNHGTIWLETLMTYEVEPSIWKTLSKKLGWKHSGKGNYSKLTTQSLILETAKNSVEQYDRRNDIEITGISDNIGDKNLEYFVIGVFKNADIEISHRKDQK